MTLPYVEVFRGGRPPAVNWSKGVWGVVVDRIKLKVILLASSLKAGVVLMF